MSKEQTAKKERFLREVERQLLRKGLDSEMTEGGILNVKWHGQLLCDVDGDGVVCFPSKTVRGVDADASLQTVIQIASQVREYMPIFARAPALKAIGLEGSYKILADDAPPCCLYFTRDAYSIRRYTLRKCADYVVFWRNSW